MLHCPCGSLKTYEECCGLYLDKKQIPQTPEQLMRSRYTAYSIANIDYIKKTMKGKALEGFNPISAQQWSQSVNWLDLKIIQAHPPTSDVGFVEFKARFREQGQIKIIHEHSEFHRENESWFYVDGVQQETIKAKKQHTARNASCPCGSGKKFKNCHAN